MKPGDRITHLNGAPVLTFGDLQYQYDKVRRDAKRIRITVDREGESAGLAVKLPEYWVVDRPDLPAVERRAASVFQVSSPDGRGKAAVWTGPRRVRQPGDLDRGFRQDPQVASTRAGRHRFRGGRVERDEIANTAELFIKLRKNAGDTLMLDLLRDGKRTRMQVKTTSVAYRK